jgi:hypothetical protein
VATEAAWLDGNNLEKQEIKKKNEKKREEKSKKSLDTHRSSHGRHWKGLPKGGIETGVSHLADWP